ncbi:MAG: transporter substrate-binding domain-containing protein, partial [Clostridia bacterium]
KGNTALKTAVDTVIDEWNTNGNMTKYSTYYSSLAGEESGGAAAVAPEGLKLSWDFGSASNGTITVYTESGFAPYEFIYNGKIVGLDIAIMSQVAQNIGKKIEVKDVKFDTITSNVNKSTTDSVGAAGLTINEERLLAVDFSKVYASSTLVVVSAQGSGLNSVASLAGKKVGVQEGTSGDLIISDAATNAGYTYITDDKENDDPLDDVTVTVKASGATVSRYSAYALAFADLQNGRIDVILMDKLPAQLMLASI